MRKIYLVIDAMRPSHSKTAYLNKDLADTKAQELNARSKEPGENFWYEVMAINLVDGDDYAVTPIYKHSGSHL